MPSQRIVVRTMRQLTTVCILIVLLGVTESAIYTYSACNSTSFLNTKTLTCEACPSNSQPNPFQEVPNECVCSKGFRATDGGVCTQFFSGATSCSNSQFLNAFSLDGTSVSSVSACSNCNASAYPDVNGTGCIPCMSGMTFDSASGVCKCTDSTYTQTDLGCFPESYTSALGLTVTSSVYANKLKYLFPGCYYFKDELSCSHLVNLCIYSQLASTPECNFFTSANLTSFLHSESTNVLQNTDISKQTAIQLKLIYFLPEGNYVKEKSFELSDVLRCGTPSQTDLTIGIGNNIEVTCTFDFNNLVGKMSGKTFQPYMYQMFVLGQSGNYYEVNVYINGNTQGVKRFFLEDTQTSTTAITVMTSMTLSFTLNSNNGLTDPSLAVTYSTLSVEEGVGVTPVSSQEQSLSYNFSFTTDLSGFWTVVIPIFIVVNILVILHAAAKTYIGYLNRKTPFLFFLNFVDVWSLWMFYFLLAISGYWFLFTKTTPSIYTFISASSEFYATFYAVFGIMALFRIVSVVIDKNEKLNMQVFMVNWERDKFKNSWREIFIINSLAEFCTYRTFSVFWLLLVHLFFMTGLSWESHSREVISTDLDAVQYFHPSNRVYLYFLSVSILLVIAVIFKILRRLSVLCWPYPFEDFVDYCRVTNISFFFMKKKSPQAFYIHASIPDKTDVTYKEINAAVRRGLNKTRSFDNEISNDNLRMYAVYVHREIEESFAKMLKKQEDQDHRRHVKYATGSTVNLKPSNRSSSSFRDEFIEKKLKPTLQQISQEPANRQRTKNSMESLFHMPPVDLRNEQGLNRNEVFFDDKMDLVKYVFPNGDQFEEIHTIIIIFLIWAVITGSSPIAALLTYFCDAYLFNSWIGDKYRARLEKMTKVKEGFMI